MVTADLRDELGRPDNTPWVFTVPQTRPAPDGRVVARRPRTVQPLDGVLSVELLPGPVEVSHEGATYLIEVPETDADLWELLEAAQ